MLRLRQLATLVAVLTLAASGSERVLAQDNDKSAVEATVRSYEQACQQFDFAKANSMLAPGARWIEDSYPEPAEFNGKGWSKRWEEYKAAKLRVNYQFRDFNTRIHGDVAWVTLTIKGTFDADNDAARALNSNQQEWRGTFVESIVLVKTGSGWRIALGHTSLLPERKQ